MCGSRASDSQCTSGLLNVSDTHQVNSGGHLPLTPLAASNLPTPLQLSWKTGCWGRWTSLSDAESVEFVEFDTHIGWQLYGKGDKLGLLSEVSSRAAVVGGLAGGMHTLVVFIALGFLFFSLSALCLSYSNFFCTRRAPLASSKEGSMEAGGDDPAKPALPRSSPLVLARDCHRWLFALAAMDIVAGLWCFAVGCAGFYLVVTTDLTEGLEVCSLLSLSLFFATPDHFYRAPE